MKFPNSRTSRGRTDGSISSILGGNNRPGFSIFDRISFAFGSLFTGGAREGGYLVAGFAFVTFLLMVVGVAGWFIVSGQNRSFDRFTAAGDLLELMDDARLSELTFTRDQTRAAVEKTQEITDEVLKRAERLESLIGDDDRRKRLEEVIVAIRRYKDLFLRYVELRTESNRARDAMVEAAVRASDSANGLQHIQDKYIRLDTESVRRFRTMAENISENSANSYEIVIFVEQALDHEKDFLVSRDRRDLVRARSAISKLTAILNQLKGRIENTLSLSLLEKIDDQKEVYLKALEDIEMQFSQLSRFNLESPKVLALDRAAFVMRDTAFALRSNERAVLSTIQEKVADMQELMARRLVLSEEVKQILVSVSEARQIDRDFLLSTTDETRRVHAARVMTLLDDVINRANKIQKLLIEDDEKQVFENVVPSILFYKENFAETVDVSLKASQTGREMVEAALEADRLLNLAQSSRLDDIAEAEEWAGILGPMGILFGIGIVLLAVLMRKAQQKLSAAYGVISSSIDYASNIQRSILPEEERFSSAYKEHFVVWEPRDRVGGDIYWHHEWGNGTLSVLADCTGHGVPGAFMSLIASSALEGALEEVPIGDVGRLIQRMHQRIQLTLHQHRKDGGSDDGLELGMIFCVPDKGQVTFAGARFSLFIADNQQGEGVSEIKGDKAGIGYRGISFEQTFSNRTVAVQPGQPFYLTTDGLIDQVGGERRRSYGKKRFKALLEDICHLPMSEQRQKILASLSKYQGVEKRRDDVSILGFRLA